MEKYHYHSSEAFHTRLSLIPFLIENRSVETWRDIFLYLQKKPLAEKVNIKYRRFLRICQKPGLMTGFEFDKMVSVLKLNPKILSSLLAKEPQGLASTKRKKNH